MAKPFGTERAGAVEFLFRELDHGLLLFEVRPCLVERPLRLAHHGLVLLQRGFEIARIHQRDQLARRNHVAFIDEQLRNAAGKLCVDVDLVGFEAAISGRDARRQPRLIVLPPRPADARAGADE